MYSYHIALNEQDYYEFNLTYNFSIAANRKTQMLSKYLFPVIWLILAFIGTFTSEYPIVGYIIFGLIAIGWIILYRPIQEMFLESQVKRLRKIGKMPFDKEATLTFSEDNFTETTELVECTIKYAAIERIIIGQKALYFFINASSAYILPVTVFADEAEKEALLAYVKEKTDAPVLIGRTK